MAYGNVVARSTADLRNEGVEGEKGARASSMLLNAHFEPVKFTTPLGRGDWQVVLTSGEPDDSLHSVGAVALRSPTAPSSSCWPGEGRQDGGLTHDGRGLGPQSDSAVVRAQAASLARRISLQRRRPPDRARPRWRSPRARPSNDDPSLVLVELDLHVVQANRR